jgi:ankyrin repeat protein
LEVIDRLIAAGTPVDAIDPAFGGHPLRTAAREGRPAAVRRLLDHGADPRLRDPDDGLTPLDLCRKARAEHTDTTGHQEVESILEAVTS